MSGVDISNQFPKSRMAQAVRLGHSRFMSVDAPAQVQTPGQENVSIATVGGTALTLPVASANSPGDWMPPTYAIVTAIGGPLYATYDGSAPSAANYQIVIAAGNSLPVQGSKALGTIRVFGTNMSVSYWS